MSRSRTPKPQVATAAGQQYELLAIVGNRTALIIKATSAQDAGEGQFSERENWIARQPCCRCGEVIGFNQLTFMSGFSPEMLSGLKRKDPLDEILETATTDKVQFTHTQCAAASD